MAVIGTFSSFTTARLAIYASQASLNVTGNNIANINTTGYTRQRMDLVSLYSTGAAKYSNIFNTNIGYGVLTQGASQIRDPYLDIRFRNENVKLGANTEKLDGLRQMSQILDEVGKGTGDQEGFGVIEAQFGLFIQSLQDLDVTMGSQEFDALARTEASTLATYFNMAAADLETIREDKVKELDESISDVNKLLTSIRDLNDQIRTQGIYGDKALELRDARNNALDSLSEYLHINVEYSMERIDQFTEVEKLTVTLANSGTPPIKLVDGIYGGQISIQEREPAMNPAYDPKAITKAMDDARTAAEAATIYTNPDDAYNGQTWEDILAAETAKGLLGVADPADPDTIAAAEAAAQKTVADMRRSMIDKAVETAKADAEKVSGKYLQEDGTGTGNIGDAKTYENDKFLLQVDPLVDRRDRLMIDPNTVSKKSEVVELSDTILFGKLQAMREMLTEEGEYASDVDLGIEDPARLCADPDASAKRGIPYYQKALDSLAKKFAEEFNKANQLPATTVYQMRQVVVGADGRLVPGGDPDNPDAANGQKTVAAFISKGDPVGVVTDADGRVVTQDDVTKEETVTNADGTTSVVRVPLERTDDGYGAAGGYVTALALNGVKDPLYEFYQGGVLFSNNGNNNDPSGITAANISIANAWANNAVHLLNDTRPDSYDNDGNVIKHTSRNENIQHMITLFNKQLDYAAQDVQGDSSAKLPVFHGSYREVFTAISGKLADDTQATNGKVENYTVTTLDLDNNRLSVSGVDLNDEATSMMQFSKSYSAACRLLTTLDEMLDKLINGTAI